ncbi:MAG: hypothetical protein K8S54_08770 [Spirochaetia bacterium]|nr:hypothetical protein [Spirochaetia bacterium]
MNKITLLLLCLVTFAAGLRAQPAEKKDTPVDQKDQPKPGDPKIEPGKPGEQTTPPKPGDPKTGPKAGDPKNPGKTDTAVANPNPASPSYSRRTEKSRIRFLLGPGYGKLEAPILSESTNSWFINSLLRTGANQQIAVPYEAPSKLTYVSTAVSLEYAFVDRLFLELSWFHINQKFSRNQPGKSSYIAPGNGAYYPSLFEGLRLLRYREDRKTAELMYLHPVWKPGLKLGVLAASEKKFEKNVISMGSYSSSRTSPETTIWSEGGSIPAEIYFSGSAFGLAARYQIFEWFGMLYKGRSFSREGRMNLVGLQIQDTVVGGGTTGLSPLLPVHYATVKEKGTRHNLEGIFKLYCRYNVVVGVMKEDYKRKYGVYLGDTNLTTSNLQKKTEGLGLGEISSSAKGSKLEIYLRFGADFFL